MIMKKLKLLPTEAAEQRALMQWAAITPLTKTHNHGKFIKDYLFAIPNGGSRYTLEAINLKRQGVKAGIPDLMLAIPSYPFCGLFIELKRTYGGKLSETQKNMIERLREQQYCVVVAYGWEDAKAEIENYLQLENRSKET